MEVGRGREVIVPVMFERRRSIAHTFWAGVRRDDMGLSGSKKRTAHISMRLTGKEEVKTHQ